MSGKAEDKGKAPEGARLILLILAAGILRKCGHKAPCAVEKPPKEAE
ncbi:MAG: hypothetical protein BWX73_00950 [Lentisphaerae bacterium ADurb.Bin082]|nr:MAG: hypothetical protein BWX73_00950 [Lentisphaerae bacterium ADurb.Bin082]